ncbi:permease [Alsobacter metallidurans]|uniref:Probable membrane transporter protein n=1 Tax=Alsobacter metallidurans TaxID=340221 RepID=A0A917I4P2_9HYPH|nr:TSUP family transporter [Alsobacter metallidurans]GGH10215.1 permease [Alsobacter metallidurans]
MVFGPALVAALGGTVLVTSFLSGIFGMAGGMILLGVLLLMLDVAPAMVLFGTTQMASNGWRTLLWRRFVQWGIFTGYLVGSVAAFAVMKAIAYVPDKATIYLGLGLLPFVAERMPHGLRMDITRRGAPVYCGAIIMVLQLLAGAAGNVLDIFFQNSGLDRKTIVATKAATQTVAHLLRVAYFGSFASLMDESLPWWVYALAIATAFAGTSLAAIVLHRMSDAGFRWWSRVIIRTVSLTYVARGLWLLITGSPT